MSSQNFTCSVALGTLIKKKPKKLKAILPELLQSEENQIILNQHLWELPLTQDASNTWFQKHCTHNANNTKHKKCTHNANNTKQCKEHKRCVHLLLPNLNFQGLWEIWQPQINNFWIDQEYTEATLNNAPQKMSKTWFKIMLICHWGKLFVMKGSKITKLRKKSMVHTISRLSYQT